MALATSISPDSADEPLLIEAHGLGVRRADRWLIRDVDIAISRGQIVSLIGPNGGGKTTTARTLLGIEQQTKGRIERQPGLRIGYVPQKLSIDWTLPLSVRHLMTLTRRCRQPEIEQRLAEVGVVHLIDAPIQTLSGGEFQRVLLARALIGKPDLLILDEPVQGVDFNGEVALYQLIRDIRDRLNCGILLVSHDLHIVMAQTDTVICINQHICCHGPPTAVAGSDAFRQLFGTRAGQVLAVYEHHHDHAHRLDGAVVSLNGTNTEEPVSPSDTSCSDRESSDRDHAHAR